MATLKGDITFRTKDNLPFGEAKKVVFNLNKAKGVSNPQTASISIMDYELWEDRDEFPDVFDIVDVEDNVIMQKRTVLLNCEVKYEASDGCVVCVAKAPDELGV
jgi:hypothetical protein